MFFLPSAVRSGFSANQHCIINARFELLPQLSFEAVRVSKFGANLLWQFCFRFGFFENVSSKFVDFQSK
ncbi:hypothetical protein ATY37_20685 [Vibrio cidicii]|uniref:Uncharacterized protein n=1 Tax=Vibrio cidicii TaxID=1763883 RepID=A0A151KU28_9VIBR|nr:hypothetical protein ATY37_20685 [Vibrio cidicii]